MITITDNTTTVTLPDDILWSDEFAWHPVEQRVDQTITGALIVQAATRQAGRPITLQSGQNFAWLTRAQLDTLKTWAAVAGKTLTLNIRGVARSVMFRHNDGAIEAEMVMYHAAPTASDYYVCVVRFLEI